MSFREFLIRHGYNEDQADGICILVENECYLTKQEEDLYWEWWNKTFIK